VGCGQPVCCTAFTFVACPASCPHTHASSFVPVRLSVPGPAGGRVAVALVVAVAAAIAMAAVAAALAAATVMAVAVAVVTAPRTARASATLAAR
jgi:hypothetical protein